MLGGGRRDWLHLNVNGTDTVLTSSSPWHAQDRVEVTGEDLSAVGCCEAALRVGRDRISGSIDGYRAVSADYAMTEGRLVAGRGMAIIWKSVPRLCLPEMRITKAAAEWCALRCPAR